MEGSSDDGFSDGEQELLACLPLPMDDSYREAPVEALEDSHSDLNLRIAGLAAPHSESCQAELLAGAPRDFSFLVDILGLPRDCAESSTKEPSLFNVDAPEFIPTLSHECPLVGFCEVPENNACISAASEEPQSPERVQPCAVSSDDLVFDCATPRKGNARSSFDSSVAQPQWSTKKTGAARKRHAIASLGAKAPDVKRSRSEERQQRQELRKGKTEMPELSPEDLETRRASRERSIAFGKTTPEYARYREVHARDEVEGSGLATPDPLDRSISKRQWKYIVQKWRTALKQLYGSDGGDTGSTVSADEGLSIITGVTDEADANSTSYGDDGSS